MNKPLKNRLSNFVAKYNFQISDECWSLIQEGQRHEIEDGLFSVFNTYGTVGYSETGTSPSEYLPSIINEILQLLEVKDWELLELDSCDEWMTAQVELIHSSDQRYQFTIQEVDDSDWVPSDIFNKMQIFSRAKCNKSFVTFFSDDPYRMLTLPHEAALEIESIIDECSEP